MYAPSLVAAKIEKEEQRLGFPLERHTRSECQDVAKNFWEIYDRRKHGWTRPLTVDEVRWIQNERALCRCDYLYYASRYAYIVSKEAGGLIGYQPNVAQLILNELRAEHELKGIAMAFLNLKARQLGVSTDTEILIAHRCQFGSHLRAIVGSATPDDTEQMFQMILTCWENMPPFLMPLTTQAQEGKLVRFGKQNVSIALQWLNQKRGIGRGRTPHICHISELCECDDAEKKIEAALMNAMHESPGMYQMFESTASPMGTWFHAKWENCKTNWHQGRAALRPTFLPWFVGSDIYPNQFWLRSHPIPAQWEPHPLTKRHASRAERYVATDATLRKFLGMGWKMPKEQMWYWETRRDDAIRSKTLNEFYAEMPADDQEAWQLSQTGIFDAEVLSVYRENIKEPVSVFGLRGRWDEIPNRLQPQHFEIDHESKVPPRKVKAPHGEFELVPLKFQSIHSPTEIPEGRIYIWEWPKQNSIYGLGCDTGYGVRQDSTCTEVCRKANPMMKEPPEFVAELASSMMSATDAVPFVYALHELYKVQVNGETQQPLLVIEKAANGQVLQTALLKMGCGNFHIEGRYDRYAPVIGENAKLGVSPTHQFRSSMLEALIKSLRDFAIVINSPWFIREMGTLGIDEHLRKVAAEKGSWDDRIIAAAMVFFSLHVGEAEPAAQAFGLREIVEPLRDSEKYASFPGMSNNHAAARQNLDEVTGLVEYFN